MTMGDETGVADATADPLILHTYYVIQVRIKDTGTDINAIDMGERSLAH
jgi:hypothetical protein